MLKHMQLLVLILCGLVSLIGCGTDNPTAADNMDIDLDSVDLAPLLNSSAGQEFTANPWDVNMDNKINLLDLFLVNNNAENAMAPAGGPVVKGPLSKGTKLSNGFYELELLQCSLAPNLHHHTIIEVKITNVGDDRGVAAHISGGNFMFGTPSGHSLIVSAQWLGALHLGESTIYYINARADDNRAPLSNPSKEQTIGKFPNRDLTRPDIDITHVHRYSGRIDRILFQAYSNMVFTGIVGIPTGEKIGPPIIFGE